MQKIKISYGIREKLQPNFVDISLFLIDVTKNEDDFIEWTNDETRTTGTNISDLSKLPNNMIEISFPILCPEDIDTNPYIVSKEKFIKFLKDWQAFGKSGKKYIYLKEDGEWYKFEDISEDEGKASLSI